MQRSIFCTECGTKNEVENSFCGNCGSKIHEDDSPKAGSNLISKSGASTSFILWVFVFFLVSGAAVFLVARSRTITGPSILSTSLASAENLDESIASPAIENWVRQQTVSLRFLGRENPLDCRQGLVNQGYIKVLRQDMNWGELYTSTGRLEVGEANADPAWNSFILYRAVLNSPIDIRQVQGEKRAIVGFQYVFMPVHPDIPESCRQSSMAGAAFTTHASRGNAMFSLKTKGWSVDWVEKHL